MSATRSRLAMLAVATALVLPSAAFAQSASTAELMAMDKGALRDAIQMRYDAGLAATKDPSVVAANDTRFLWASETKVQCGIALGFLKSGTKDETSISKCDLAYQMMNRRPAPPPPPPPPPPPQRPAICDDPLAGIAFFDWDSDVVSGEAGQTLQTVAQNVPVCGWSSLTLVGHTDLSGSNAYNDGLSQRRAEAVEAGFRAMGVNVPVNLEARGESEPRVPTEDGVREPQNRRVEISGND